MNTTETTITITDSERNNLYKVKAFFENFATVSESIDFSDDLIVKSIIISHNITEFLEEYERIKEDEAYSDWE